MIEIVTRFLGPPDPSGPKDLGPGPWFVLIFLFLASRLLHISAFPLFIDEAVYLSYAEEVMQGGLPGFGDGKPFEGIAIAAGLSLGFEPAAAARLPHVLAGALTLLAMGAFAQRFLCPFQTKASIGSSAQK